MKVFLALLLSLGLAQAQAVEPATVPSTNAPAAPSPTPAPSELEAKLRKQADDLKKEMDEKLKDAKATTLGLFDAAKKKLADAAAQAAQSLPTPTPAPTPVATPTPGSSPASRLDKPTSEHIAANPDSYIGHMVSLSANIKAIEPDRFVIDGDIIVPANMDAFDKRESPRDKIEVRDGNLVRTTVLPQKIGRTVAEVILVPGQIISVNGKVEKIGESLYIRGNVSKAP